MYCPLEDMNFDISALSVNQIAFTAAGVEPEDVDWIEALVVDDADPLYVASIGESIALLVGPERGDTVTTHDLAEGDYQVWVDVAVSGSDERIVRVAGLLEVSATGS